MTQIGSVQLTRNDGTETFDFKATSVEYSASNGVVTSSVISALREVIGGKLVIENETIVVKADVKNMDSDQFPNSGTYSDEDLGFESELRRAHKVGVRHYGRVRPPNVGSASGLSGSLYEHYRNGGHTGRGNGRGILQRRGRVDLPRRVH